jgi:tRNA(Ile2) C34 agmatinyltransferase TiaS
MMKSIMRFPIPGNIDVLTADIENMTRGHVVKYTTYDNLWMSIEIEHHDMPLCPECGGELHAYGHGLCRKCWSAVKKEMGAIS